MGIVSLGFIIILPLGIAVGYILFKKFEERKK